METVKRCSEGYPDEVIPAEVTTMDGLTLRSRKVLTWVNCAIDAGDTTILRALEIAAHWVREAGLTADGATNSDNQD